MLFEIMNPSDPYTMDSPSLAAALGAVAILGEGRFGLRPIGHTYPDVPPILFGDWLDEVYKHAGVDPKSAEGLMAWMNGSPENAEAVALALDSVRLGGAGDRDHPRDPENDSRILLRIEEEDESNTLINAVNEPVRKILTEGGYACSHRAILFEAITSAGNEPPQVKVSYRSLVASLEDYLSGIGDVLEVYFTIERMGDTETHDSPLSLADVLNENVGSADALITKLSSELEGVTVVRSDFNPAVIHLIEAALLQDAAYPLVS